MQNSMHRGGKAPRQAIRTPPGTKKGLRQQAETQAETSQHQAKEKIAVTIDANLLQCCVCSSPLMPPLFQVWMCGINLSCLMLQYDLTVFRKFPTYFRVKLNITPVI